MADATQHDEPKRRPWTADDLMVVKLLTDARISPDGAQIAYVVMDTVRDGTKSLPSSIWIVDTTTSEARQWTHGPRSDTGPRWSPDGQMIAFRPDREEDGRFGLYVMSRDGGEARRVVEVTGSVQDVQWAPDGRRLAFSTCDEESEEEKQKGKDAGDIVKFERDPKYVRVSIVDLDGTNLRVLSTGAQQIWEFAWFPTGDRLAVVCSDFPYEWSWYQAALGVLPVEGGEVQVIAHGNQQLAGLAPSPDGTQIAYIGATWSDRNVVGGDVWVAPTEGGAPRCLTADYPGSFGLPRWNDQHSLDAVGYKEGDAAVARITLDGEVQTLWTDRAALADRVWTRASWSADGTVMAVIREDPLSPADVWTARRTDGKLDGWTRHTQMHPHADELALPEVETLHWTSPDGTSMQGLLLKPIDYAPGQRYPLVTVVHGGPTSHYPHSYPGIGWFSLLASHGMAVLLPNPRGSTGWGRDFAEANLGDMGGRDFEDILAGIDCAVERGVADPQRLGIAGWSYGGFMTAWAVTQTDRFKAAMMGAGIANWRSFHGTSNLSTWDRRYYEADPYELGGRFDRFSPVVHIRNVRTPTLILHGEQDANVPVGQAYEFFRALREHGVEVELVVYPREGHGIQERAHMVDLRTRVLDWFARHLGVPL